MTEVGSVVPTGISSQHLPERRIRMRVEQRRRMCSSASSGVTPATPASYNAATAWVRDAGPYTAQQHGLALGADTFDGGGGLLQHVRGSGIGLWSGGIHQPEPGLGNAGNILRAQPGQADR